MIFSAKGHTQNTSSLGPSSDLPRVRSGIRNGAVNSLWKYDAYPDLQWLAIDIAPAKLRVLIQEKYTSH
jgi:hypothetical protein